MKHDEGVGPGDALAVTKFDIFALEVTQTTLGAGTGNGLVSPSIFFRGGDVAFDDGGKEALDGFTLTTAHNQAPAITLPSPAIDYTIGNTTKIDPLVTVTDADSSNFDGGTLTVSFSSGSTTNDDLSILVEGPVSLSGSDVQVSSVTIGTFSGGTLGTDLVITWNASSTAADIETVLSKIAYKKSVGTDTSTRIVDFTLSDGDGGTSSPAQQTINFSGIIAPVLTLPSSPNTYTENGPPVIVDAGAIVIDTDSPDLNGGTLTVSIVTNRGSNDLLNVVAGGNVTLSGSDILVSGQCHRYDRCRRRRHRRQRPSHRLEYCVQHPGRRPGGAASNRLQQQFGRPQRSDPNASLYTDRRRYRHQPAGDPAGHCPCGQ